MNFLFRLFGVPVHYSPLPSTANPLLTHIQASYVGHDPGIVIFTVSCGTKLPLSAQFGSNSPPERAWFPENWGDPDFCTGHRGKMMPRRCMLVYIVSKTSRYH